MVNNICICYSHSMNCSANATAMLQKLECDCKLPTPELERYLYLQVFNKEDSSIMYRVKVNEEQTTNGSTFRVSAIWCPRTLVATKSDYMCFGRQASCTFMNKNKSNASNNSL